MTDHNKNPRYYGNNKVGSQIRTPKTFQEKINAQQRARRRPNANRSGIYKITNDRTGETYIGQTKNFERRRKSHENELRKGTHHNRGMQSDYLRGDTFTFTVLEETSPSKYILNQKEEKYISKYNSFNQGYNQTPGGQYDKYHGYYGHGGGRLGNKTQYSKNQEIKSYASNGRNYGTNATSTYSGDPSLEYLIEFFGFGILYLLFSTIIALIVISLIDDGTWESLIISIIIGLLIASPLPISVIKDYRKYNPKSKAKKIEWKTCDNCGHKINSLAKKCPYCEYEFKESNNNISPKEHKICPKCKNQVDLKFKICPKCYHVFQD